MNTVEILQAAKAKITTPANWIKGYYAKDGLGNQVEGTDSNATCFCSLGAIEATTGINHCNTGWPVDAVDYLREAVTLITASNIGIVGYNDSRTHAQVIAVWDKAIELATIAEGAK